MFAFGKVVGIYKSFFCYSMNAGSVVEGTLKLYHILKNIFELIALKVNDDGETLGMNVPVHC